MGVCELLPVYTYAAKISHSSPEVMANWTAASLIPYGGLFEDDSGLPPECCIIVDVGYSFTHVIPMRDGQIIWEHVKRHVCSVNPADYAE